MQSHPSYPHVQKFCTKYPEQAGALWQAYVDLSLSQRWEGVEAQDVPGTNYCILIALEPKGQNRVKSIFLPIHLSRTTNMAHLQGLFDCIEPPSNVITLAIAAEDSSVVYYKIGNGIVAPKENKA